MTDEKDDLVKEMRQYKKKETDSQARIKKLEAEVNALQVRGEGRKRLRYDKYAERREGQKSRDRRKKRGDNEMS